MSWPEAFVIVASIAGLVGGLRVVLPYVRSRSDDERRAVALKAVNDRLGVIESELAAKHRLPTGLPGRRTA